MSYSVHKKYFYRIEGKELRVLKYAKFGGLVQTIGGAGGVAASATVTISDKTALAASTHNVSFVTTNDTTITATVTAHGGVTTTGDTDSPTFAIVNGSNDNTAENLKVCLDANSKVSASRVDNVVTITQTTVGTAGNRNITLTDPGGIGMTKTDFTGGVNASASASAVVPSHYYGDNLIYPDETITDGIRLEYTAIKPISAPATATNLVSAINTSFSADAITAASGTPFSGVNIGDYVYISYSTDASNDGIYEVENKTNTVLTVATGSGNFKTLTTVSGVEINVIDETFRINADRLVSSALVDYVKALELEERNDFRNSDNLMKRFWKKISDSESNKRDVSVSMPMSPFGVR